MAVFQRTWVSWYQYSNHSRFSYSMRWVGSGAKRNSDRSVPSPGFQQSNLQFSTCRIALAVTQWTTSKH